jgi:hypothetical protein
MVANANQNPSDGSTGRFENSQKLGKKYFLLKVTAKFYVNPKINKILI